MAKKNLKETNPYLKDPQKRRDSFVTFVSSSTAIETPFTIDMLKEVAKSAKSNLKSGFIRECGEPDQSPP